MMHGLDFALVASFSGLVTLLIMHSRLRAPVKTLLIAGLLLRLAGSQVYLYLTEWAYGFGDYTMYHQIGGLWAESVLSGPGATVYSPYLKLWGTGFTVRVTGALQILLGRDIRTLFLVFSLIGYSGIVALASAFTRAYPDIPQQRYLAWIVLFPSLWYWPAALGKDALILAGVGFAVLGYVGRRDRISWLPLLAGVALVFGVRPQLAALLAFAMIGAHAVSLVRHWTLPRLAQAIVLSAAGIAVVALAGLAMDMSLASLQDVEMYLDRRGSVSAIGGSALHTGGGFSVTNLLLAPINVLFRPFPWEARGVAGALASLEIMTLWFILVWHRRRILAFIRTYRRTRLFWFSVFFLFSYVLLAGLALGNLGLIARQRVHVFPFLFVFLAGAGARASARRGVAERQPALPGALPA